MLPIVLDHGEGLRIMNDDEIVVKMVSDGVLTDHIFVDLPFLARHMEIPPLEPVVHLLGDAEEVGGALDDAPPGFDSDRVEQDGKRTEEFGYPTPVVGGVYVGHMQVLQRFGLFQDSVYRLGTDKRFIIFKSNDLRALACHVHSLHRLIGEKTVHPRWRY
jgi:hypothetical protein